MKFQNWVHSKKILLLISASSFFLFVLFSYLVARERLTQFDFDTTVKLQDNIPRRFDVPFSYWSDVGAFEVTIIFLIIFLLLFYRKWWAIATVGFFGLFHVIEIFGKNVVDQFPPPQFMLRTEHWFEFPQFHVRSEFSYPSGHSGRAAFISVVIAIVLWRSKKIPLSIKLCILGLVILYDVIMWVSRAYLGEHWMSDVIGGILLGISMGIIGALW